MSSDWCDEQFKKLAKVLGEGAIRMKCPDCWSRWPSVIVSHVKERGTYFCSTCEEWFTVTQKKRSPMIRTVMLAVLCMGFGAGGASVDWRNKSDEVVEWLNAPSNYTNLSDFYYWRQCDECYDIFADKDRNCCKTCGNASLVLNLRARLIGTNSHYTEYAEGYQTVDGVLYIIKGEEGYFTEKFFLGQDLYTKDEAIIARNASLR